MLLSWMVSKYLHLWRGCKQERRCPYMLWEQMNMKHHSLLVAPCHLYRSNGLSTTKKPQLLIRCITRLVISLHELCIYFGFCIRQRLFSSNICFFSQSQMKVKSEGNFAIQMFAKQPGHVIVSLTVSPHPSSGLQIKDSRKLTDEVQIQVTLSTQFVDRMNGCCPGMSSAIVKNTPVKCIYMYRSFIK